MYAQHYQRKRTRLYKSIRDNSIEDQLLPDKSIQRHQHDDLPTLARSFLTQPRHIARQKIVLCSSHQVVL